MVFYVPLLYRASVQAKEKLQEDTLKNKKKHPNHILAKHTRTLTWTSKELFS